MDKRVKEIFDKRAWSWQVRQLSIEEFFNYENGIKNNRTNSFYGRTSVILATEIYSQRTAHLLNYIFNLNRWQHDFWDFHRGGGFLIDSGIQVRIGKFNEVYFEMTLKNTDIPYGTKNISVMKSKIYKMVKKAINEFIKDVFEFANVKTKNEIDDNGFIIKDVKVEEVEILIKHFNFEDVKKISSDELITKVFGKKTENQFEISASEVIENQIKTLVEERNRKRSELKARKEKIIDWIMTRMRSAEKAVEDEYKLKIEEMENHLHEIMNGIRNTEKTIEDDYKSKIEEMENQMNNFS